MFIATATALGLCFGALASQPALAQAAADDLALPKAFKITPLIKSTKTASGMLIKYPASDKAEMIAVIGEMEPGGRTALHQHPVPVVVYILEGTLTVQSQGHDPRDFKPGQIFLEDIDH
jgi:quercetin dioxygenase-like cupin family protein